MVSIGRRIRRDDRPAVLVLEPHREGAPEAQRLQPILSGRFDLEGVDQAIAGGDRVARRHAERQRAAIHHHGLRRRHAHAAVGLALGRDRDLIVALAEILLQQEVAAGAVVLLAIQRDHRARAHVAFGLQEAGRFHAIEAGFGDIQREGAAARAFAMSK